ncbi:hypothetical protein [Actinocrispum wychmicini]|nr:hypothetical protein [Actinocrispum wychmicini]
MQQTASTRLASILLGVDLKRWVAERRDRDRPASWLNISRELAEATNGQVSLSHEALRMRYGQTHITDFDAADLLAAVDAVKRGNNGPGRSDSENDAGAGPESRHPFEQKRPGGPQWLQDGGDEEQGGE